MALWGESVVVGRARGASPALLNQGLLLLPDLLNGPDMIYEIPLDSETNGGDGG